MAPVVPDTFVITRRYPVGRERVFAAFADEAKKRRWFTEAKQQEVELFEVEFRVGGAERARYRFKEGTPFPGAALNSEGVYLDIVADRRIVSAATMSIDDRRFSAAMVTIELTATAEGTELVCTHQAVFFEGADGPEMRRQGWEVLFDRLAEELAR
ncbi:MAG: SRPBCC family protein [Phenylobacterium sp.]